MAIYHKTVSSSLSSLSIDEAIAKGLEELNKGSLYNKPNGPVILVSTSMVVSHGLIFITIIARSADEETRAGVIIA